MSEWRVTTIETLGAVFDGPHATPTRINEGPFFLNIASLEAGRLDLSSSDHVSEDDFSRWTKRVTPRGGDLLFSYETRLGEAALMPNGVRACLGRRMALLRPDRGVVDPKFLLYLYLGPAMQKTIELNTIHGATVNRIPLNRMGKWEIAIPGLPEQQAIADVLGALDDKIASNLALMAKTRELALLIARAKAPMTQLANVVIHHSRQVQPASMTAPEVDLFSLPGFDSGRGPERVRPSEIKSGKFFIEGSVLLVSKLNPRIPRIWPIDDDESAVPKFASTEFLVLEPFACTPNVLWALLSQPEFTTALEGQVAGTSGSHQRVSPADLLNTLIPDPRHISPQLHEDINGVLAPVSVLYRENRTLAATRDALLPQLMSGTLRVRDAGTVASAAGA